MKKFLELERQTQVLSRMRKVPGIVATPGTAQHSERKHSKFSASGAERWCECPGSVTLSEGLPDKSSSWAEEGTRAHEILETLLIHAIENKLKEVDSKLVSDFKFKTPAPMTSHTANAANFILKKWHDNPGSTAQAEEKIHLKFIHSEMFGTFDAAIIDYFGTLHVFDFKYGAGVPVSPVKNLQMIFYALGVAYKHHWNFKNVRLWIIQPRIKGYDGPLFWGLTIQELKDYIPLFEKAVQRVENSPKEYSEGEWCRWCRAKSICPLKLKKKQEEAIKVFTKFPITNTP